MVVIFLSKSSATSQVPTSLGVVRPIWNLGLVSISYSRVARVLLIQKVVGSGLAVDLRFSRAGLVWGCC